MAGPTVYTVLSSTPNDGSHLWKIRTTVAAGSTYKLQVSAYSNAAFTDMSDNTFTIINVIPRTITVIYPDGGLPAISRGSTVPITWSTSGGPIANVQIRLERGTSFTTLNASTPNDGAYD